MRRILEQVARNRRGTHIQPMYCARRGSGRNRVNENYTLHTLPSCDEFREIAVVLYGKYTFSLKPSGSYQADSIVEPEIITDSDDHDDSRITFNFRKCVAQEIHGS